ncbi:MAG: glutamine amidotransferase [Candidatus Omnitrophica bacterium]|nr:glutamine amidotransferase [Candidatus Omnitrophota bacterium]
MKNKTLIHFILVKALIFGFLFTTCVSSYAHARDTILVLAGLGNKTYLPVKLLHETFTFKYSYLASLQTGFVLDKPFPQNFKKLKGIKIIIMADVPASALNGLLGRMALWEFVKHGGGLLYFGGPFAFGKGDIRDSLLESVLPVTTTGPWDMIKSPGHVKTTGYSSITAELDWSKNPYIFYEQKVKPKSGSNTLLRCNGTPVLITGRYGKGKVAVFTGTYFGNLQKNKNHVFFYKWQDYPELLTRILNWLRN